MGALLQDLRYAIRMMRHAPGFTGAVVTALALGIGANTAIFSIVYGVLLKPLPYPDPGRLVAVLQVRNGEASDAHSLPNLTDYRSQATTVNPLGGYATGSLTLTDGREAQSVPAAFVDADLMDALGVQPQRGRSFTSADDGRGAPRTALVSDAFWTSRFDRDESVLGRTLRLDGDTYTIIGVMPPGFAFPIQAEAVQIWAPMRTVPFIESFADQRGAHFISILARLKAGVLIEQAQADLNTIAGRLAQTYPATNQGRSVRVDTLHHRLIGAYEGTFSVLLGAVAFVLLIACANVANLLIARSAVRQREIAVRLALGASRGRLIVQLLTESVLLAAAGGAAGLVLASWVLSAIARLVPLAIPRLDQVTIDTAVLAFTAAISLLTGVLFGLAPALQSSRPNLNSTLKDAARATGGVYSMRTRNLLVMSEVALALVLLVGASLLTRSFLALQRVDPGFAPDRLLTVDLAPPMSSYSSNEKLAAFYGSVLEKTARIPGVERAAIATTLPLTGANLVLRFTIDGRPAPDPQDEPLAQYCAVSPGFFETLGIPLRRGRLFTDADTASATPTVAIVSESVARKYWAGSDAVGRRITIGDTRASREIVGVVADVKGQSLTQTSSAGIYVLYPQRPWPFLTVLVRSSGDPLGVAPALRAAIREVDPGLPVEKMTTMREYVSRSVAQPRFSSFVLAAFALLALVLSALGIYGVMAYMVAQRTREIGIRIALGAQPGSVARLIVSEGMRTTATGVALGLAGALALSRVLAALVFEVGVHDAVTFAAVPAILAAVALLACYIPARRATGIDPVSALRSE